MNLATFYKLPVSTSGLSRHVIRVAGIMKDVYDEILNGVKIGVFTLMISEIASQMVEISSASQTCDKSD